MRWSPWARPFSSSVYTAGRLSQPPRARRRKRGASRRDRASRDLHRPRQPETPDVALSGLRVPVLWVADRRLLAIPGPQRLRAVPGGPFRHTIYVSKRVHPSHEQREHGAGVGGYPARQRAKHADLASYNGGAWTPLPFGPSVRIHGVQPRRPFAQRQSLWHYLLRSHRLPRRPRDDRRANPAVAVQRLVAGTNPAEG